MKWRFPEIPMIPSEIIKKVRKIQFKTTRLLNAPLAGQYASVFKGMGIEFDEVREYVPGDEIRTIDWNVTARAGSPYVKRYVEERELTMMLVVDVSGSQYFGASGYLKSETAAEISAVLAFLAITHNDRVGLLLFSDRRELYLPPQKGRRHVLRVIREILNYRPAGRRTDLAGALSFTGRILKHRSIVFLISDFLAPEFASSLQRIAGKHDTVAILISDPREGELPPVGLVEFEDLETGEKVLYDTSYPPGDEMLRNKTMERRQFLHKLFKANKVDYIEVTTARPYIDDLQKFFITRQQRLR